MPGTTSHFLTSEPGDERFKRYTLSGLIPEDSIMIIDTVNLSLNLLRLLPDHTQALQEQQRFTQIELTLVLELFAHFPNYCPFENLLQVREGRTIAVQRERLYRALEEREVDSVLTPLRNNISRCRAKLHMFGIDICNISETGYLLISDKKGFHRSA
jgi:hypothetical protein